MRNASLKEKNPYIGISNAMSFKLCMFVVFPPIKFTICQLLNSYVCHDDLHIDINTKRIFELLLLSRLWSDLLPSVYIYFSRSHNSSTVMTKHNTTTKMATQVACLHTNKETNLTFHKTQVDETFCRNNIAKHFGRRFFNKAKMMGLSGNIPDLYSLKRV